jgi:hypothetical protein
MLLVERAGIVGQPLLNHGVIRIEFRRSGGSHGRRGRREIVLDQVLSNGFAVNAEAGRNRAGAEALLLQRFDRGLLGHAHHNLLKILLWGAARHTWPHLTAGSSHSQIGVMKVGNSS